MEKENYIEIHVGICPEVQWYQDLMERMKGLKVNRIIRRCHVTALFLTDDGLKDALTEAFDGQLHQRSAPRLTFDKLEAFTSISGKEHIVCVTSTHPETEFMELVEGLRGEAARLGAELEESYRLHVTLVRVPVDAISLEELQQLIAEIPMPAFTLALTNVDYRYRMSDLKAGLIKEWELKESFHGSVCK